MQHEMKLHRYFPYHAGQINNPKTKNEISNCNKTNAVRSLGRSVGRSFARSVTHLKISIYISISIFIFGKFLRIELSWSYLPHSTDGVTQIQTDREADNPAALFNNSGKNPHTVRYGMLCYIWYILFVHEKLNRFAINGDTFHLTQFIQFLSSNQFQ